MIKKDGFRYGFDPKVCDTCNGKCCRGDSGRIWIKPDEIHRISEFLEIPSIDFIQKYLLLAENRYTLLENHTDEGFECVFFDTKIMGCLIYPVRPVQCRTYPFWDVYREQWDEVKNDCPGIMGGRSQTS